MDNFIPMKKIEIKNTAVETMSYVEILFRDSDQKLNIGLSPSVAEAILNNIGQEIVIEIDFDEPALKKIVINMQMVLFGIEHNAKELQKQRDAEKTAQRISSPFKR